MPALTWDVMLSLLMVTFIAFGFAVRKYRAGVLISSLLISYSVTQTFGLGLFRLLQRMNLVNGNGDLFLVNLAMFVLFAVFIFIEGEYVWFHDEEQNGGGGTGSLIGAAFGLIAGGVTILSIYGFMSFGDQNQVLESSSVMRSLEGKEWLFFLPFPLFLVVSSLIKRFR